MVISIFIIHILIFSSIEERVYLVCEPYYKLCSLLAIPAVFRKCRVLLISNVRMMSGPYNLPLPGHDRRKL